jgi:hypothetical protein
MRAKRTFRVSSETSATAPAIFVSQARRLSPQPDSLQRLPRTFRRCPGFDNDCPDSANRSPGLKSCCPESKTFRPDFENSCPEIAGRCPDRKSSRPGSMSRCPGGFRFCPEFLTLTPVLKAVAPISGAPRLLHNSLPPSNLRGIAAKKRKIRKNPFVPFVPFGGQPFPHLQTANY